VLKTYLAVGHNGLTPELNRGLVCIKHTNVVVRLDGKDFFAKEEGMVSPLIEKPLVQEIAMRKARKHKRK
jgi:tRNA(His) 5'-end guanylyltransferase